MEMAADQSKGPISCILTFGKVEQTLIHGIQHTHTHKQKIRLLLTSFAYRFFVSKI